MFVCTTIVAVKKKVTVFAPCRAVCMACVFRFVTVPFRANFFFFGPLSTWTFLKPLGQRSKVGVFNPLVTAPGTRQELSSYSAEAVQRCRND